MEPTKHDDFCVFVGLRADHRDSSKDPSAAFAWLTREEGQAQHLSREIKASELMLYDSAVIKKLKYCNPGSVYAMTKTDTGISYTQKVAPQFVLANEQVTRWHTMHRAVERDWQAAKRLKKDATYSPDRELLEPFRTAYGRLHGPAQAQLIADVVAYIARGRQRP